MHPNLPQRVRAWKEATHAPQLELCRHFFGQFFESESISTPGQLKLMLAGMLTVLGSVSVIFLQSYYHKYLMLKQLDDVQPYRLAVLADVLFLIALIMVMVGLVTTLLWQQLFPDHRDYLALAALPIRMQEVFRAKFLSLFLLIALVTSALALMPSIGFPAMIVPQPFTLQHRVFGGMGMHVPGIFVSSLAAGLFVFFLLVALQGVLLNVLPLRTSARLLLVLQASLVLVCLGALPLAVAIPRLTPSMAMRPDWAVWVPPLWFLGLHQWIVGTSEPLALRLTRCAAAGLGTAAISAVAAYWWSYRRHRVRVLESSGAGAKWDLSFAARESPRLELAIWKLFPDIRGLAVFSFAAKTLGRSRQHRLILTGFIGIAVAFLVESVIAWFVASEPVSRHTMQALSLYRTAAVAAPLTIYLFTLCGLRYLFRLPVEPRANWVFRIHEPGNAAPLLGGVERLLLYCGVAPIAIVCLPAELLALGPKLGTMVTALTIPPGLLLVEVLMFPCDKLPFTSLYLPASRLMTETLIKYCVATMLYISLLSTVLTWCAEGPLRSGLALATMLIAYVYLRSARLDTQQMVRLEFEELPEAAAQTLGIERD